MKTVAQKLVDTHKNVYSLLSALDKLGAKETQNDAGVSKFKLADNSVVIVKPASIYSGNYPVFAE